MMSSTYINRVQRLKQHLRCFLVDVSTFAPRQGLLYHACSKPPSRNRGGQPEGIYGSSRLNTTCLWIRWAARHTTIWQAERQSLLATPLEARQIQNWFMLPPCACNLPKFLKKLTCCKTHPQDSTSQTLFRRSVLSCLFLFGSLLPQTPQALLPAGFGMYLLNSSHQQLQCNSHRHGSQSRAGLLNDFQGRRCGKEKLNRDTNDIKWSRMLKFAA